MFCLYPFSSVCGCFAQVVVVRVTVDLDALLNDTVLPSARLSAISETVRDEAAEAKYSIVRKCIQIDGNTNNDNLRKKHRPS